MGVSLRRFPLSAFPSQGALLRQFPLAANHSRLARSLTAALSLAVTLKSESWVCSYGSVSGGLQLNDLLRSTNPFCVSLPSSTERAQASGISSSGRRRVWPSAASGGPHRNPTCLFQAHKTQSVCSRLWFVHMQVAETAVKPVHD